MWLTGAATLAFALLACSSGDHGDEAGDVHHEDGGGDAFDEHHDAAQTEASAQDALAETGAGEVGDGGLDAAADAPTEADSTASNVCSPPCGAGTVCCLDQHGHNPSCLAGTSCPPPYQTPDGG
jgi:hypothetical protein